MLAVASRVASRTLASRTCCVSGVSAIAKRGYHENIVEHYENPRNVGSLDKNDDAVGTVRGMGTSCLQSA
jgi:iron-sulfur cluster assembly enzyme ISCU, mitochondrial